MTTLIRYNWRCFDEVRGRYFVTRYKATEEEIRKEHPDATAMSGTREELVINENWNTITTSSFLTGIEFNKPPKS